MKLACAVLAAAFGAAAIAQPPELVLLDGKIVTVDAERSVHEALAVRDGKILSVGSTAEIRGQAGPDTRVVDLDGRTVIPGLIDSHLHAVRAALSFSTEVNWIGARAGINYWMNVTSDSPTVDRVALESRELFERFSLIDPQRTVSARAVATRFRSERFGYAIDLTGTGLMEGDPAIRPPRFEFLATVPGHGQGTGEVSARHRVDSVEDSAASMARGGVVGLRACKEKRLPCQLSRTRPGPRECQPLHVSDLSIPPRIYMFTRI